jgi:hypothetical protein
MVIHIDLIRIVVVAMVAAAIIAVDSKVGVDINDK